VRVSIIIIITRDMSTIQKVLASSLLSMAVLSQTPSPSNSNMVDPDFGHTFAEICSENGFLFETHSVVTKDGYINTLFRIPGTIAEGTHAADDKPSVYF
jgi:Partial alpha/beta-hydrolase lipase region